MSRGPREQLKYVRLRGIALAVLLAVTLAGRAQKDESVFQARSNSVVWDQDRWKPWVVTLAADDVTHVTGYNAELAGRVHLTAADDVEPRKTPYGFVTSGDTLRWTVNVPTAGRYRVAVMYHPGRSDNLGSKIVVGTESSTATCFVHSVKEGIWVGGNQDHPSFKRDWLQDPLTLHAGRNTITLHVVPNARQAELAQLDLAHPAVGWPKRSLHILGIEVVRWGALPGMERDAERLKSSTEWMVAGKYGLFIHWVPESYPLFGATPAWQRYQEAVDAFDVDAFAKMVSETGAAWVVFTTTHGKYYFPGPLRAMDEVLPGRTCKRDLVGEMADALGKRNIRLMLYFHPGPGPAEDPDWAKAAGISPVHDEMNIKIMLSMYREIGERYGDRLAGWFIDGGDAYYWRNFSFRQLTIDLKAGNPARVVTYFQWLFPIFSPYAGDFISDIVDFGAPLAPPFPREWFSSGGPYAGLAPQYHFTLEDEWYPDKPMNGQWPPPLYAKELLVEYFTRMAQSRWPLTINMVITQDVTADHPFVSPVSLVEMEAVRKALREQ
jgi:Alpha-L-fucosidase